MANAAFLLFIFTLTVYGIFHGEDLHAVMNAMAQADFYWLIPGVGCVVFFIWGESIIIWYLFFRRFLFQLYHSFCQWRTANAALLYEERKDFPSSLNGNPDDRNDHL